MSKAAHSGYRIGERLRIRGQRWLLTEVHGPILTLRGLDPANAHEPQLLFEPFEQIERLSPGGDDPFSPSTRWASGGRRWRRAWREMVRSAGPWTSLRTLDDAGLEVWPHQLTPAQAVLSGRGSRVLLADAVGLGKTVQAAILLAELKARGAVRSALVLAPAGLRDQWRQELRDRVGLDGTVVDSHHTARSAAVLPLGMNPWQVPSLAIASVDFVKRPEVLNSVRAVPWDLVIVDEAHGISPGSDRYAAVAPICANALFVLLLTATPHSGDRPAFAALCGLGGIGDDDRCLVFRRTRADVQLPQSRRVHQLPVRLHASEAAMHAALDRYGSAWRRSIAGSEGAELLLSVLRKRALSSPDSLRSSVERRLRGLLPSTLDPQQGWLPIDPGDGESDGSDDAPACECAGAPVTEQERPLLVELAAAAEAACRNESKLSALARLLRRLRRCREPVVVFTEFRDTLLHIQRCLVPDALVLHGGLERAERGRVVAAFVGGDHPVLLTTDAGGEGLNLHRRCRCVVNLEVPWNPVRLEQRAGRVDRIGQHRRVHVFCLLARHPSEARLLERVQARVAAADADIGMADPLAPPRAPDAASRRSETEMGEHDAQEAHRILRARRLTVTSPRTRSRGGESPLRIVARARLATRARLAGRILAILEWKAVDSVGRAIACDVTAVRIDPRSDVAPSPPASVRKRGPAMLGPSIDCRLAARNAQPWLTVAAPELSRHFVARHASFTDVQTFWRVTAARAAAIAAATSSDPVRLFQPGLFDRRAEELRRLRDDERAAIAALTGARAERLAAACEPPTVVAARLLLLVP